MTPVRPEGMARPNSTSELRMHAYGEDRRRLRICCGVGVKPIFLDLSQVFSVGYGLNFRN